MDELQRIKRILSGNTSAFSYFVETYQDMAITIAYRIIGNMQDAEDVVQESFVKAFRNLHSYRGDSKFSTWLYRIVFNTATTYIKTRVWLTDNEIGMEGASYLEAGSDSTLQMEETEQKERIVEVLKNMPVGDALLLTLYYLEENSVKDVAHITGLNESNVKVKMMRARKLFKDIYLKKNTNEYRN